jgi:hypothetical protein
MTGGDLIVVCVVAVLINAGILYVVIRMAVTHAIRESLRLLAGSNLPKDKYAVKRRLSERMQADLAHIRSR